MSKKKGIWLLAAALGVLVLATVIWRVWASPKGADRSERCTVSIRCETILDNRDLLLPEKADYVPDNGVILDETAVDFAPGESAFDVLKRVCRENNIQFEFSTTPGYDSAYIEGIGNLYSLDCGQRSGWMYQVNGQSPDRGCSEYTLTQGDRVAFLYSCDWGEDLG